jgi:SAM-dependent methyltransferase
MTNFKEALKPFVFDVLIDGWKRCRFEAEQWQARGRPLQDVFTEIYERNLWAPSDPVIGRYHSGPGSRADVTAGYEDFVAGYISRDGAIATLVDIGCGDFQVARRILDRLPGPICYTGCDIVANLVAYNRERHGVPGQVSFEVLDVSTGTVPAGDIVTVREVFQHLSNDKIRAALANLARSFDRAIITESVYLTPSAPNRDIASGYRTRDGVKSGVYLDQAPFNLRVLDRYERDASDGTALRTLVVQLRS